MSRAAGEDLGEIIFTINEHNPAAATRLFYAIKERCASLTQFPESGKPVVNESENVRQLNFRMYVIRYQIVENKVQILRIVDGRRNLTDIWDEST